MFLIELKILWKLHFYIYNNFIATNYDEKI